MGEKRSLFNFFFGKENHKKLKQQTQLKMLNGFNPTFSMFSGDAYDSDIVRSVVDAIARNGAKLKAKHVRANIGSPSNLEKILQYQPNRFMDSYSFFYKIITNLYMKNNAFIYIHKDDFGMVKGFYPIDSSTVELLEAKVDGINEIFAKFRFPGGQILTIPYDELIHLRRYFYRNDLFGETSDKALNPTLQLIQTTDEGIANAVKSSAHLRGLLKFTTNLHPDDLKKQRDLFVEDYMNVNNNGGVAATDAKTEYQELKNDPKMIDDKQMNAIKQKVYDYFGVNGKIVQSNYTEDDFNAFYESILEPIAIQMSLEFTNKLFTDREKGFGNAIVFEANRLQYASNKTKLNVIETLMDRGLLSKNEGREIFNMSHIPDGDKRIVSLNFIDVDKANEYQLAKAKSKDNSDEGSDENNVSEDNGTEDE